MDEYSVLATCGVNQPIENSSSGNEYCYQSKQQISCSVQEPGSIGPIKLICPDANPVGRKNGSRNHVPTPCAVRVVAHCQYEMVRRTQGPGQIRVRCSNRWPYKIRGRDGSGSTRRIESCDCPGEVGNRVALGVGDSVHQIPTLRSLASLGFFLNANACRFIPSFAT